MNIDASRVATWKIWCMPIRIPLRFIRHRVEGPSVIYTTGEVFWDSANNEK
jgi:hypothetical protein